MTTSTAFDHKASAASPRATYLDVFDAPEHTVAEIIDGTLHTHPRPAPRHATVTSVLGNKLGPAFHGGDGGPGGWRILDEPELHLGEEILVPDLAGWRRERMPDLPDIAYFTLAPDWACHERDEFSIWIGDGSERREYVATPREPSELIEWLKANADTEQRDACCLSSTGSVPGWRRGRRGRDSSGHHGSIDR